MSQHIPVALRAQVRAQAAGRCAFCQSPEELLGVTFEIDHVVPVSAGGTTSADNLCLSCPTCKRHKAARMLGPDPLSRQNTPLFRPRSESWNDHFAWSDDGATIIGITPTGRATVESLPMNRPVQRPLFGSLRDPHVFRQVRVDADLGTLVWPNGADIDPNVLYDWPRHVNAIVQRRRQRWAADYGEPGSRERFDRVLQKVAETDSEPYEMDRFPDSADLKPGEKPGQN